MHLGSKVCAHNSARAIFDFKDRPMKLFKLFFLGASLLWSSEGPPLVSAQAGDTTGCEDFVCCIDCECCSDGTFFNGQQCAASAGVEAIPSCSRRIEVCVVPECVKGDCCGRGTVYDEARCTCVAPGSPTEAPALASPTTPFPTEDTNLFPTAAPSSLGIDCDCQNITIAQAYSVGSRNPKKLLVEEDGTKKMCEISRLETSTVIFSKSCICNEGKCAGEKSVEVSAKWTSYRGRVQTDSKTVEIPCEAGE
jgi:hypothetical protein